MLMSLVSTDLCSRIDQYLEIWIIFEQRDFFEDLVDL